LPLLCLGISLMALSQTNFQKGFIITTEGDTTTGLLKHNTYSELSQSVEFRSGNSNVASVLYKPKDLKGFAFEGGDVYKTVQYTDAADSNKRKTEFAHLVLEGYYDMYVLARGLLSNYLIKGVDTSYVLYDDKVDQVEQKIYLGNYRNMMAFLGRDCNLLHSDFEKLSFTEKEITRMMRIVNANHKSISVVHRSKANLETHIVVHAGGFMLKDLGSQLSGGAELRVRNTNFSRKLYLVTGLHYSRTVEIEKKQIYYPRQVLKTENLTEVYSLPVTVHYTMLEKIVQPYVYVGFGAAYRKINFKELGASADEQLGKYGLSVIGGIGIEVYPVRKLAIKADWRYELLMQHPTLGIALKL
jgi:hypothetical protein